MTAVDLPAHPALRPRPLDYEPASSDLAGQLQRALGATEVHRARTAHAAPYGYYRVAATDALFVKVFPRNRLPHLLAVQALAAQLHRAGCPVQPMLGAPLDLSDDAVGLVYAHIAERFAQDNPVDAEHVGSALRSIHNALAPIVPPAAVSLISEQWRSAITGLGKVPLLDPSVDALVADLLSRWDLVAGSLDRDSQLIHNDYHRGNVLMGPQGVAAVLDFDDAVAATGSPLIDLAIGLERFCLADTTPVVGARLAAAFLAGYGRGMAETSAGELERIAIARLLFSLGILHANPRSDDPGWQAENSKLIGLLRSWPQWRQTLIATGFRT